MASWDSWSDFASSIYADTIALPPVKDDVLVEMPVF
jgi:hypothetical protein